MSNEIEDDIVKEETTEIQDDAENNPTTGGSTVNGDSGSSEVLSYLRESTKLLNEIKETIQGRLEYDKTKEEAFNKLYEEMKKQQGFSELVDRSLKPLLTDLLLFFDSMKKFEASLQSVTIEESPSDFSSLKNDFNYLLEDLEEIFYRQEVIPAELKPNEAFNSKFQKAIKTVQTDNQNEDSLVIEIMRQGFTWREKILRPQEVAIKKFNQNNGTGN